MLEHTVADTNVQEERDGAKRQRVGGAGHQPRSATSLAEDADIGLSDGAYPQRPRALGLSRHRPGPQQGVRARHGHEVHHLLGVPRGHQGLHRDEGSQGRDGDVPQQRHRSGDPHEPIGTCVHRHGPSAVGKGTESGHMRFVSNPSTVTHADNLDRDLRSESGKGSTDTGGPIAAGGFSRASLPRGPAQRGDRLPLGEGLAMHCAGVHDWPGQRVSSFVEDTSAIAAVGALDAAGDGAASCLRGRRAAQTLGTLVARVIQGQTAAPGPEHSRGGLLEAARGIGTVGDFRDDRGAIRGRENAPGAMSSGASVGSSFGSHPRQGGGQRGGCEGDATPLSAHDRGGGPRIRAGLGRTSHRGEHEIIEHFDVVSFCGQAGRSEQADVATLRKYESRADNAEARQAGDAQAHLVARGGGGDALGGARGSHASFVGRLEEIEARCNAAGADAATQGSPEDAAAARQLKTVKFTSPIAATAGMEADEALASGLRAPTTTGATAPRSPT